MEVGVEGGVTAAYHWLLSMTGRPAKSVPCVRTVLAVGTVGR